jgi:hypothetical protein
MRISLPNSAVLAIAFGLCGPVLAQTMFRCGNGYQDRPCDSGQPGKVVGTASPTPAPAATSRPAIDGDCGRRGAAALKLVWQREAGVTEEAAAGAAHTAAQRRLVSDVYARRGTAPEVRAGVEADCVLEKQRAAQAAGMMEALARQQEESAAGQRPPDAKGDPLRQQAERKRDEADSQQQLQDKQLKQRCAELVDRLRHIQTLQRRGADAAGMEALNQQRRDVERARRDASCPA